MQSLRANYRFLLVVILMGLSVILAEVLRPVPLSEDQKGKIDLERVVPRQFGDWIEDPHPLVVIANPQQQELVQLLYSQTLQRTYIGRNGDRIMLSIAYGGSYGEGMATHKPEICYPAQGFKILTQSAFHLQFDDKTSIPASKLVAQSGSRIEPITYWVVVGSSATSFGLPMKLQQLKAGLTGVIPDGLLFRVSSIDSDEQAAFARQQEFVQQLLEAIPTVERHRFIGRQE